MVAGGGERAHPVGGEDYPRSLPEFLAWFPDEASCLAYLERLRWRDGFSCPACGWREAWRAVRHLWVCRRCERQLSVTAGTVFHGSRLSLAQWFLAVWLVTRQKHGMSALGLQRELDLGSYRTAWTLLHKLRTAMVRPGRDKLAGEIELDESSVGGPEPGKRGRGALGKAIVAIAVETYPSRRGQRALGRVRMTQVADLKERTLTDFVRDVVEAGAIVRTDALKGYNGLAAAGFSHVVANISASDDPAHVVMPGVHRVASLLKRWLLGTHQGSVRPQHLDYYLDEFTFRFDRRSSKKRGLLFYRLLEQAVTAAPTTYETIVWSRRDRWPQRKGHAEAAPAFTDPSAVHGEPSSRLEPSA
jgi:transposase-like protein